MLSLQNKSGIDDGSRVGIVGAWAAHGRVWLRACVATLAMALAILGAPAWALTATTTTIVVSPSPAAVGQLVTVIATVAGSSPTGTVQFMLFGSVSHTGTLSGGQAVFTYAAPYAQTVPISAVYGGDSINATSTSSTYSLVTNKGSTATALTSSVNPAPAGQNTTLTATVTPSGSTAATGTVTFKDGTTTLGTGTLTSNVATFAANFAATGAHSITAVYGGDSNYAASTSGALSETVNIRSTTTTIVVTPSPAAVGQVVTVTATTVGSNPTGTVQFQLFGSSAYTAPVVNGQAVFSYGAPYAQTVPITAVYSGDSANTTSTSSTFSLVTNKGSTSTTVASSANPASAGQNMTLTATVTPSGSTAATGTVTFKDGTTTLGTGTLSSNVATLATSFATTGAHGITAVYGGDSNYTTSTSGALSETVNIRSTTTSIVVTPSPAAVGQLVTVTATTVGSNPTGTVQFQLFGSTSYTAPVVSGQAVFSYHAPYAQTVPISAIYSGDSANATSTSSTFSLVTNIGSTATAVSSSVNPASAGQNTTLTATVTPSGSTAATGTITFKDGATTLGTGTLASNVATLTASFGATGTHTVTAVYGGDSNYATSTSSAVTETVTATITPSSLTLTTSANPVAVGAPLTLSAAIVGASPTGTVQFKDGGSNLGSPVGLVSGQATYNVTPSTIAGHLYSATYSGDPNNAGSSGQVAVNVTGATSTTTLGASATATIPTTSVTLTATIAGSSPTGSVVFRDGAMPLHTSTLAGGVATWAQTFATGQHVITASYLGDATNAASASTATSVQISADGSVQPATALQWNYQYDAEGNLTKIVDANSATTQQAYDSLSRTTKITQPVPATGVAAPVVGLGYDLQDQPATVTDPRTLTTTYTVDGLGNATGLSSPDTGATTRTFYDNGLLKTSTDARGKTSTYTYDALDRLKTVAYSDGGTGITNNYDAGTNGKGHLTSFSDESGSMTFTYDGFGRVLTKSQTSGPSGGQKTFVMTYTWGTTGPAAGKLLTVKYPSGAIIAYAYDNAGRVNDVTVTGTDGVISKILTGLSYTPLGQPGDWVWGDGTTYRRVFDAYGRLVSYPLGNPSGTGVSAGVVRTLAFDAAGRIVGYSHSTAPNWDQVFAYDGLDRLTGATLTGGNTYGYAYDPTGNRTQTTINGTPYASTVSVNSNWYTNVVTAAGGATAQGYDLAGHLTSDAGGTYTYSGRGRLTTELRSGNTFSYLYNAFEQRVYKGGPTSVITTGKAYYAYDEAGHLVGEYDSTGKAVYETVYLGDLPVAALTQPALGQTTVSYIYSDHLNTARVIVRVTDQAILWTWGSNEPFGQSQATNPNSQTLGAFAYNPRFPGQVADTESGWFYNWHRDYNPAVGRYVQSDPIGLAGGNMSTFMYANESSLSVIDPDGLSGISANDSSNTSKPSAGCDQPDCAKVKDTCIARCSMRKLPTYNYGFRFWNCVNACMKRGGCNPGTQGAPAPAPAKATGAPDSNSYPEPPHIEEAAAAAAAATGVVMFAPVLLPALVTFKIQH